MGKVSTRNALRLLEELGKDTFGYWKVLDVSKQSRQKKLVSTPEGMTEREHAKLDGLLRIYDCGKIRYKYERANV